MISFLAGSPKNTSCAVWRVHSDGSCAARQTRTTGVNMGLGPNQFGEMDGPALGHLAAAGRGVERAGAFEEGAGLHRGAVGGLLGGDRLHADPRQIRQFPPRRLDLA